MSRRALALTTFALAALTLAALTLATLTLATLTLATVVIVGFFTEVTIEGKIKSSFAAPFVLYFTCCLDD